MSHPFTWVPGARERHASTTNPATGRSFATGTCVTTLCEREVIADNDMLAWFWTTCPTCNAKAHELAGLDLPAISEIPDQRQTPPNQ